MSPFSRKILLAASTLAASVSALACEHSVDGSDCAVCVNHAGGYPAPYSDSNYASPVAPPADGVVMEGSNPAGGGSMSTSIPPVNTSGVFAPAFSTGGDSRMRTAKSLVIYCHDDAVSLSDPAKTAYMRQLVNDQRQWLAVNSGGKMDSTYQVIDSGTITYKSGTTPWSSPLELINSILSAQGLVRSDYDYIQLNWNDMDGSPYVQRSSSVNGEGYVGNGFGTQVNWSIDSARKHELGHNLGFDHASDLHNAYDPRYTYDFASKQYVPVSAGANSPTNQMRPLAALLYKGEYGNPIDPMAHSTTRQYNPRDKARAGWLDSRHFAALTPGTDGVTTNITLHDPNELVAVVSDNSINPTTGLVNGAYGVAKGYGDTPYAATFVRKGQTYDATTGKWVTGVQLIDLNYVQISPTTYGVEFRVDGVYFGVIQAGQNITEKNFGQYNYIVEDGPPVAGPSAAPDNPDRYRSSWYDIRFVGAAAEPDAIGNYGNLAITTHIGSTVTGFRWDASGNSGATQDGAGVWNSAATNWKNLDASGANTAWVDNKDVTFGAASGAAGSVTVDGTVVAKSLTFKPAASGVYSLSGGTIRLGAGGLNAEASANIASALNFTDQQVWEILGGNTVSVSGGITANGNALMKIGLGDILLASANTLPRLDVYEGAVTQTASQTVSVIHLHDRGRYIVQSGALVMNNGASVTAEKGFTGAVVLNSSGSTAAAPDIALLADLVNRPNVTTSGEISAALILGAGNHYITAGRGVFTNYDYSLSNGLYRAATLSGDISGDGGITYRGKETSAQLVLSGDNTFTGGLTIENGSVHLVGAGALDARNTLSFVTQSGDDARLYLRGQNRTVHDLASSGIGQARIANFPAADNGGTATASLTVVSDNATTFGGVILDTLQEATGNGNVGYGSGNAGALSLVKQGAATLTLTGNNTYSGTTTITAGMLQVGSGGASGTLGSGAVSNSGILRFNRADNVSVANAISGSGVLSKFGAGTLTLTGLSTNTGATQVSAGALLVNGALGDTAVTVATGATFGGTGRVGEIATHGATVTFADGSALFTDTTGHLLVNGDVRLDGATRIDFASAPTPGTYRVLDYTGSLTGVGSFYLGVRGTVSTTTANQVNVTTTGALSLTWKGTTDGVWGRVDDKKNFASGGVQDFYDGDTVLMDDTATRRDVTLTGQLRANALTVNTVSGYTLSGTGALTGSATLTKQGSGTLVVKTDNTNTGATTISAGTLQIGDNTAAGSLGSGGVSLGSGTTLALGRAGAYTLANNLTGGGTLRQLGYGVTTLTGNNSGFAGATQIDQGGTLAIGSQSNFNYIGEKFTANGTLQFDNAGGIRFYNALSGSGLFRKNNVGRLDLMVSNTGGAFTGKFEFNGGLVTPGNSNAFGTAPTFVADKITLNGGGISNYLFGNNAYTSVNLGANFGVTLGANGGTFDAGSGGNTVGITVNSVISGNGSLTKTGDAALALGGANTYSGGTFVKSGSASTATNAAITLNNAGGLGTGDLVYQNTTSLTGLRYSGANAATVANKVQFSGTAGLTNRWLIDSGKTVTFSGVFSGGSTTSVFQKDSAGTLILTGNNSYLGTTTITAGTLVTGHVNALGASKVTVATNAILQIGDGVNNGVTLGSGATLALATDAVFKLGAANARITMTGGTYTLSNGFNLDIRDIGLGAGQYTLITGATSGTLGTWSVGSDLLGADFANYSYALAKSGSDLRLTVTAVPEPAAYGLLGAGALAAATLVRRRRKRAGITKVA